MSFLLPLEFVLGLVCLSGVVILSVAGYWRAKREDNLITNLRKLRSQIKTQTVSVVRTLSGSLYSSSVASVRSLATGAKRISQQVGRGFYDALQYVRRAEALFGKGHVEEAKQHLIQALSVDENNENALKVLAEVCIHEKEYLKAEQILVRLVELHTKDADVFAMLGDVLMEQGRFHPSVEAYKRAVELQPKRADFYSALASNYLQLGEYGLAKEAYEQAYKIEPREYEYLLCIGKACIKTNEIDEARKFLNKLLDNKPYHEEGRALIESLEKRSALSDERLVGNMQNQNVENTEPQKDLFGMVNNELVKPRVRRRRKMG